MNTQKLNIDQVKDILVNQYEHLGSQDMVNFILEPLQGQERTEAKRHVQIMANRWEDSAYIAYTMDPDGPRAEAFLEKFVKQYLAEYLD